MRLFLDIDDTIIRTESLIRERAIEMGYGPDNYCVYRDNCKSWFNIVVESVFSNLEVTDSIFVDKYALPVINRLRSMYTGVYFVSDCFLPSELLFKQKLSAITGIPLIPTSGDKSVVYMNGGIFIDDRVVHLVNSNASRKICKYTKFNYEEACGVELGRDWSHIGELLGVFVDDIGAAVCKGVQVCYSDIRLQGHL